MIALRDVRKRFGSVAALDGITAEVPQGAFVLLLGSNGAGKTTLLRCILGLLRFDGTITVGGHDVARDGRRARALLGYVPQRPALPADLTCTEVLDLFARLRGRTRGDGAVLGRVGLEEAARAPVRTLSGGMRQRLALAVALQADPAVLLFDEPATSLDVAARRALHRDLEEAAGKGRTVLLATHLAAEPLQIATRALVLHRGRVVYDGPPEGLGGAVQQRVVFGVNGVGRAELTSVLTALPGVRIAQTPGSITATTRAGGAFEVLAAVAAAGVRPVEVHVEEPTVDPEVLAGTVTPR
ncbi:MAG: ABC transporter ATP-binding protein [Armatimonadota bacterium]|nr:ABC transporter ATP-binding protein [Armatimonadota bacterium]